MPRVRDVDPGEGLPQYIGNMVRDARLAKGRAKAEGKDWSQTCLAGRVFESQTRISEVELGDVPPDRSLASKLEKALDLPRDCLVNLVRFMEEETVRDYAKPYLDRQAKAHLIHTVGYIVPGLLQTPDYARALLLSGQAGDPTDIERYVDQRMERQKVWERPDPLWLSVVLDESALLKCSAAQLERLLEDQEKPNISLRALPFGAAGHALGTVVALLTMPNGSRGAYTEGFDTGNYTEDIATVLRFQRVYDRLADSALTVEATTDRLHEALKRLK
ncbi:Scr1 family TA system antitoxin-like transcriptional regulator [Streptomyces sp. NPDC001339]|uniref:helix-turn-helix domain-containing protein n=1 Tax=Streptomyces sp. NPDC001339 TaxID=3364563 RepID=UPI0036B72540